MNFNSPTFLIFFPLVLVVYTLIFRRERLRESFLLAASYCFYGAWSWKYAGLLLLSTVVDYFVGLGMYGEERPRMRKALLLVSLVSQLGLLAIFKYYNFFVDVAGQGISLLGFPVDLSAMHLGVLLPVGISFYTFQTLSYTIDVYRGEIPAERSFIKFALFVSFFPQLVAGPIVRAADFLPQLHRDPNVSDRRFQTGLSLVFRGLFKKIVIADLLATLGVDAVFAHPGSYSSVTLLFALYGYAFQIYNDFSGYSDVAIGAARMLGFDLMANFDRPYISQNVREFWTRWHISLSTWLRDYLYIPLGGNRGSRWRVRFNLMATMLLGGLWHGAALNFVFWGAWHGLLLTFARGASKRPEQVTRLTRIRNQFITFHLVTFSWLLFRIGSWDSLVDYVVGLLRLTGGTSLSALYFAILATAAGTHFVSKRHIEQALERFTRFPVPVQAAGYAALIVLLAGMALGAPAFIYFQF